MFPSENSVLFRYISHSPGSSWSLLVHRQMGPAVVSFSIHRVCHTVRFSPLSRWIYLVCIRLRQHASRKGARLGSARFLLRMRQLLRSLLSRVKKIPLLYSFWLSFSSFSFYFANLQLNVLSIPDFWQKFHCFPKQGSSFSLPSENILRSKCWSPAHEGFMSNCVALSLSSAFEQNGPYPVTTTCFILKWGFFGDKGDSFVFRFT